jgi:hypothetical protein
MVGIKSKEGGDNCMTKNEKSWFADFVNKTLGKKPEPEVVPVSSEDERRAVLEKEKQEATKAGKAWVAVLDTQVNPENIKNGFFELDWNNQFIEELLDAGYSGETNEAIVDAWFRSIVIQMLEEEGQSTDRDMGYINVVPIDKGKSEVS